MYELVKKTPPAKEPITLAAAKEHLRVDLDNDDDLINRLIRGARAYAENFTGRSLITQTWDLILDHFPSLGIGGSSSSGNTGGYGYDVPGWIPGYGRGAGQFFNNGIIELPRSPVQSVSFIKYLDLDGNLQTLDPSQYVVDVAHFVPRIAPIFSSFWPIAQRSLISPAINVVTVEFIAGYCDDPEDLNGQPEIPPTIIDAIFLLIGHRYSNREGVITGLRAAAVEVPNGITDLLWSERVLEAA